jgi:signal transduction histidine kinase
MTPPRHEAPPVTGRIAEEIARLELLRRLSMGAAHTLNNAFTAILGETLCLLDERKSDPVVAEACALIQQEVERCARLMRSVATRVHQRDSMIDECDLGGLLRGIEPILRETVSRAVAIECASPGPGLYARGGNEDLELLVLLSAHRLVRASVGGGGALAVRVEPDDAAIDLVIEARVDPGASRPPEPTDPAWEALVETATRSLAERCGVALQDEGPLAKRLRLAAASS